MRLVIVTGMSGAGRSTTLKYLEDFGYYCVDNMPVLLIDKFVELIPVKDSELEKVALGVDVRDANGFSELENAFLKLKDMGLTYEVLFLESSDDILIKRYKETRRSHPLSNGERIEIGIERERQKLKTIKKHSDYIIDTSQLLTRELKAEIERIFVGNKNFKNLYVTILSFGFKYGIPADADLVFDVRFLKNPYYVEELRNLTGNDKEIQDFVMASKESGMFLEKLEDILAFLIPNYITEGKNQLVVAIGCTGGKHRSVTLANALYKIMEKYTDYGFKLEHRDIDKDSHRGK